jgi:outer membrane protein OmpA-like peptidoglycan-associated protein
MKMLAISVLALTAVFACRMASAQTGVQGDLSGWGQSGATPVPAKDSCRSGHWWWPTEPASNESDGAAWGNRGVVYGAYTPKVAEAPEKPKSPKVKREIIACSWPVVWNHVLFDFDKSTLKPESKREISKVVSELKKYPQDTVLVKGHTCDDGAHEWNMGLGQRRADSVKQFMIEEGIDPKRISTRSFGETKPAVENDTPVNHKLNRRVVMQIILGK